MKINESLRFEIDDNSNEITLSKTNTISKITNELNPLVNRMLNISDVFNGLYHVKKLQGFELEYDTILPNQWNFYCAKSGYSTERHSKNIKMFLYSKCWENQLNKFGSLNHEDKEIIKIGILTYFKYFISFEKYLDNLQKNGNKILLQASRTPEELTKQFNYLIKNSELIETVKYFLNICKQHNNNFSKLFNINTLQDILLSKDKGIIYLQFNSAQIVFLTGYVNYVDELSNANFEKDEIMKCLNQQGIKKLDFNFIEKINFNGKQAYMIKFSWFELKGTKYIPEAIQNFCLYMSKKEKFLTIFNPEYYDIFNIENCTAYSVYKSKDKELSIKIYLSNDKIDNEDIEMLKSQNLLIFKMDVDKNKLGFILIIKEK